MRFKLNSDKRLSKLESGIITLGENMADTIEIVLPPKLFGFNSDDLICVFSVDTGKSCLGLRLPISRCDGKLIACGRLPGYLLSIDGSCRVELADGLGTVIKSTSLPFSAAAASDVETLYDSDTAPNDNAYEVFRGCDGKSAYELAVENGFSGSLAEWLDSLSVIMGKKIRSVAEVSRIDDTMVISYDDKSFDTFIISDGKDGIGISEIKQVAREDGCSSELIFTMTDGSQKTFLLFDGESGADGANGVSCTHAWNGTVLTVTSASGTTSADLKGEKGADGISPVFDITENESGYTVTITDKDGTRTVDVLSGVKGEKGDRGEAGADGADGYTPVRGTDYWTEYDKSEIKSYVDDVILSGEW